MKRNSTDRGAILLSILILAILWFLYGRYGGTTANIAIPAVTAPAILDNAVVDNGDDNDDGDAITPWYAYLQDNDYTNTQSLSEFGETEIITRATATPFLARYGFLAKLTEKSTVEDCTFPDTANKSVDLQKTITVACAYDLLRGSDGNFIPDRVLSKDELLTVLVRTKTGFLAEDTTPWFKNYFDRASTNGLVDAGTTIDEFAGDVTKADLGQWLYKLSLLN